MKRNLLKNVFFALAIVLSGCSSHIDKIIGGWRGQDKGKEIILILDTAKNATLINNNQVLGGKDFAIEGVKAEMKYEIDYTKNPVWFDLIFYEKGHKEEKGRLTGIIKFLTDTKIQYRINFIPGTKRFESFDTDDKTNTIVFDKVSK